MTTDLFIYLLEASICLAAFYMFFRLLLQQEPLLHANRFFILGSVLLSTGIPLIDIPLQGKTALYAPMFVLQDIVVAARPAESRFPVEECALYAYLLVTTFVLIRLVWQTARLVRFSYTSRSSQAATYRLVFTEGKLPTFSFFRLLFWDNNQRFTEEQRLQVFGHELAHIRQWHSLDIMFLEMVKVFFWFHPAIYLLKKDLQQTHEYLADAAVVQQHNQESYIQLIVAQVFQSSDLSLINPFSQFKTKNRIMMLHKLNHAKPAFWKIALSLPLVALLVLIYSCDKETAEFSPDTKAGISIKGYQEIVNKYQQKYPNLSVGSIMVNKEGESPKIEVVVENVNNESDRRRIEQELNQAISTLTVKDLEQLNLILPPPPPPVDEKLLPPPPPPLDESVYRVVEVQPAPNGGIEALMQYIGENIRYPAEARQKGIEGKVFIQFVVNKDGSIGDTHILKGIGHGCDEEAVRVLKAMPAWKPGTQKGEPVPVLMSIPITFKLD
jgi:TonB family protein